MTEVKTYSAIIIEHQPALSQWKVYIPPRGPQDYEGNDVKEGAIIAPYGDSFWPTRKQAEDFVGLVLGYVPDLPDVRGEGGYGCPQCGRDDAIVVVASAVCFVDLTLNGSHMDEVEWGAPREVDILDASSVQCGACKWFQEADGDTDVFEALGLET